MALVHCICVKALDNIDIENHLRYGPLLLPCFQCAAFSKKAKIWRTLSFVKSCFSPCCPRQPLLRLPRDMVRGFVRTSSFQHGQLPVQRAGAAWPSCLHEPLPSWQQSTAPVHRLQVGVSRNPSSSSQQLRINRIA